MLNVAVLVICCSSKNTFCWKKNLCIYWWDNSWFLWVFFVVFFFFFYSLNLSVAGKIQNSLVEDGSDPLHTRTLKQFQSWFCSVLKSRGKETQKVFLQEEEPRENAYLSIYLSMCLLLLDGSSAGDRAFLEDCFRELHQSLVVLESHCWSWIFHFSPTFCLAPWLLIQTHSLI